MLIINSNIKTINLIYFFHYYPLTEQDYKIMEGFKDAREFNGYLFRRIRKYASKIPLLIPYVKDVLFCKRMNKSLHWFGSDDKDIAALEDKKRKVIFQEKMDLLLEALISEGQRKHKEKYT